MLVCCEILNKKVLLKKKLRLHEVSCICFYQYIPFVKTICITWILNTFFSVNEFIEYKPKKRNVLQFCICDAILTNLLSTCLYL